MLLLDGLVAVAVALTSFGLAFAALWAFSRLPAVHGPAHPARHKPPTSSAPLDPDAEADDQAANLAPMPLWTVDSDGQITWANEAYFEVALEGADDEWESWPPPRIFAVDDAFEGNNKARLPLATMEGDAQRWFSVLRRQGTDATHYIAVPADDVVAAERALQTFVQTLTKTFAMLPTGLSIFDRDRRLALFNPALTDLTNLPVSFLSARPTLYSFLDTLREKRMVPEPKDYKSFRQQLVELEAAAADGTYEENWTLPTGQTYRVTGRPHPDGAVAFLFQDISAEISLTRRFRSELEMGQAVIDSLSEAVAVFAPSGVLALSNARFEDLWGMNPMAALGEVHVNDATRLWAEQCKPNPIWGDIRAFVSQLEERSAWSGKAQLVRGGDVHCRIVPISGNATMVSFSSSELDTLPDQADKQDSFA